MNDALIFALSNNKNLAKRISEISGIPLGECEINHFSDGEILARNLSNVKGKTAYVVQSTCSPSSESLFEILIFIDALKNSKAKEVVVIMPYYGFSRQDRIAREGEPITAKVVANMLQSAGANEIIAVDLHTGQIQGFFQIPVLNLETPQIFSNYFLKKFDELSIPHSQVAVVSPDHGSDFRARDLSSAFNGATRIYVNKRRPGPNKSEVVEVTGEVKNKVCILIDDIIDTCGTVNNATAALFEKGAKEVYICATHAIFSSGSIDQRVKEVVVTDTVENKVLGIKVLSVAELIAQAIIKD